MAKITVSTMALLAAFSLPAAAIAQTNNNQQQVPQAQINNQTEAVQKTAKVNTKGLIMMQDQNTFLASDLTGATVYSPQNDSIGDVNDVIVSRDGKVDGIVIGVGGFLGIGEKDVAIKMSQIKMTDTDTGVKLVLNMTKDELAAAPEFKSKTDMQAQMNVQQPSSTKGLAAPDQVPAQSSSKQSTQDRKSVV